MKLAYYIKEDKLALIPGIPDLTGKIRETGAELYREMSFRGRMLCSALEGMVRL